MRAFGLALLLLACVSCQHTRDWAYVPAAPRTRTPVMNLSVCVPVAIDRRPEADEDSRSMCLIPLVPYGWAEFSRPEKAIQHMTSTRWRFRPDEDIAMAVATELQTAGLFKQVFFTRRSSDADLTLRITIESLDYEARVITYGLSLCGTLLWFVLPSGTVANSIDLSFELEDRSGETLWTGRSQRTMETGAYWLYSMPSDFEYERLLQEMLLQDVLPALEGLKAAP